jgi:lipopolysaccharide transport system ATP-binding protein
MPNAVIKVENLSKKYVIAHQVNGRAGQSTLRDAITDGFKSFGKRFTRQTNTANPGYEDFWALNDMSFEIGQGDRVGIIGHNGAGKSTLLKILSRITEPTHGRITLEGRIASLLEVGTGFHRELTGRENIFLNGAILGMGRVEIQRKFDEIVDFSGVEKFLDTPVKRYSSGMYVRLAFAVAAHLEPEILIVDEVLAVGDMEFQKKCLGKMKEVGTEGRTVLFVSHNMSAIQTLCDSAILLKEGKLLDKGSTESIVAKYLGEQHGKTSFQYEQNSDGLNDKTPNTLLKAAILNSEQKATGSILFNEPFSIRCEWMNNDNINALSYTIRVFSDEDTFIFAINTIPFENLKFGIIENILVPGVYRVEVSAWVRPHTLLCKIENCLSFTVEDIAFTNSKPFTIKGKPIVAPKAEWIRGSL